MLKAGRPARHAISAISVGLGPARHYRAQVIPNASRVALSVRKQRSLSPSLDTNHVLRWHLQQRLGSDQRPCLRRGRAGLLGTDGQLHSVCVSNLWIPVRQSPDPA